MFCIVKLIKSLFCDKFRLMTRIDQQSGTEAGEISVSEIEIRETKLPEVKNVVSFQAACTRLYILRGHIRSSNISKRMLPV